MSSVPSFSEFISQLNEKHNNVSEAVKFKIPRNWSEDGIDDLMWALSDVADDSDFEVGDNFIEVKKPSAKITKVIKSFNLKRG